jgi:hypothetical protein
VPWGCPVALPAPSLSCLTSSQKKRWVFVFFNQWLSPNLAQKRWWTVPCSWRHPWVQFSQCEWSRACPSLCLKERKLTLIRLENRQRSLSFVTENFLQSPDFWWVQLRLLCWGYQPFWM